MKLNHADDTPTDYGLQLTKFDDQVISRHHKVVDIIRRHLKDIRAECGRRRRQGRDRPPVLTALVEQLRGFAPVHHDFR